MRPSDNFVQTRFWVEHHVFLWYHSSGDGEYRPKDSEIEKDCPMWSDFKVKKKVRVDERGDQENGSKRSCDECNEPTEAWR